jgi:hypothetical protein
MKKIIHLILLTVMFAITLSTPFIGTYYTLLAKEPQDKVLCMLGFGLAGAWSVIVTVKIAYDFLNNN